MHIEKKLNLSFSHPKKKNIWGQKRERKKNLQQDLIFYYYYYYYSEVMSNKKVHWIFKKEMCV